MGLWQLDTLDQLFDEGSELFGRGAVIAGSSQIRDATPK